MDKLQNNESKNECIYLDTRATQIWSYYEKNWDDLLSNFQDQISGLEYKQQLLPLVSSITKNEAALQKGRADNRSYTMHFISMMDLATSVSYFQQLNQTQPL